MKSNRLTRFLTWILVLGIVGGLAGETRPVAPAHAQAGVPGVNTAVAFFNLLSMTNRRNRIYREARLTQEEMDAYYDSLIATARQQLQNRQLLGASQSQLSLYVKMIARLEQERAAATHFIEAEKNQARRDFNRNLGNQVTGLLANSPGGQAILGEVRNSLQTIRAAADTIKTALEAGNPIAPLVEEYASRFEKFPELQDRVRQLGSALGGELDRKLGGLFGELDSVTQDARANLDQAISKLDELDFVVTGYQQLERQPLPLIDPDSLAGNIIEAHRPDAVIDVAAQAYANAILIAGAVKGPRSTQRQPMREAIRQQLLEQRGERLQQAVEQASLVDCTGVGRAQYELAVQLLGLAAEQPRDPEDARYLVCGDLESGLPFYAALIGQALEPEAEVSGTPSPTAPIATAEQVGDQGQGSLPVEISGTYTGEFNYFEQMPGHNQENTITITIAHDGTVRGEGRVVSVWDPFYSELTACEIAFTRTTDFSLNGKMSGDTGSGSLSFSWEYYHERVCEGYGSTLAETHVISLALQVENGVLYGVGEETTGLTFRAEKQGD